MKIGDALLEISPELIPEVPLPLLTLLQIGHGQQGRCRKPHDQCRWQCAGAQPCLLAATPLQGDQLNSLANHQRSDALRAIKLVGTEAHQIQPQLIRLKWDVSKRLGGIAVKGDVLAAADRSEFLHRLEHSDLVVGGHHTHESGVGGDCVLEL